MSKGSTPRPLSIPRHEFDDNWEQTFLDAFVFEEEKRRKAEQLSEHEERVRAVIEPPE